MKLETERLILRNLRETDLEDFHSYRSNAEICKFQSLDVFTIEDSRNFIKGQKDAKFGTPGEWVQVGIESKENGKLVGDLALKPTEDQPRTVEIGVTLNLQYQGKGFAIEAFKSIFEFLFGETETHRIFGILDTENHGSRKLMENLNFRREAHFVKSYWDKGFGEWRDEYVYALLKEDWLDNNCFLSDLSEDLKPKFLEMAAEFRLEGDDRFEKAEKNFDEYLEKLRFYAKGKNLPEGIVPENTYFVMCGEKMIGRVAVRHRLNPELEIRGGHIGYDIRPSERRKGYGTLILKLALKKAGKLGLKKVLISCDTDNIASSKIIEKNGGKLSERLIYKETGTLISHYRIEL